MIQIINIFIKAFRQITNPNSTAISAVLFRSSKIGFTSTNSAEVIIVPLLAFPLLNGFHDN